MQRTGSKKEDLLSIETYKVTFTLRGGSCKDQVDKYVEKGSLIINCTDAPVKVQILTQNLQELQPHIEQKISPIFFEQTPYDLCIEYDTNDKVEFVHKNEELCNQVSELGKRNPYLGGTINFKNEIGCSDFVIKVNGREYLKVTIEVFSRKIDYKQDFKSLIKDIEEEVFHLSLDYKKRTYQEMGLLKSDNNSQIEFMEILKKIFRHFSQSVSIILHNTNQKLHIIHQVLPVQKAKRIDKSSIKWTTKHSQYVEFNKDGIIKCEKLQGVKKQLTFDTNENRLVKWMILDITRRLVSFYEFSKRFRSNNELGEIARMNRVLRGFLNTTFLKSVGKYNNSESMSLVFSMAPGYRELYKYYNMLKNELVLCSSIFHFSVKDTAKLYEYWCFLKLNRILKDNFIEKESNIISVNSDGVKLRLTKGLESLVKYENPLTGQEIKLIYNRQFSRLPTGYETPDYLLSFNDINKSERLYILDAKYKINHNANGPKREDIEVMHRYRDAIVRLDEETGEYECIITGCYVLFPYKNEEVFKKHQFYKSIKQVNIGGLPFLPSAVGEVEKHILELAYQNILFSNNAESFNYVSGKLYFAVPQKDIPRDKEKLLYIALCQKSKALRKTQKIQRVAKINGIKTVKGSEVKWFSNMEYREQKVYVFSLEPWKMLPTSFKVTENVCDTR